MCIIAIKKSGIPFPSEDTIENMWYSNPDGAGIMYTDGSGKVNIDKGFMKLEDFLVRIEQLKEQIDVTKEAVVMHFRIGTHGGNTPENTHPFPISKKVDTLKKLSLRTSVGVAHNGIISIKRPIEEISDTMEYIRSRLTYRYHRDKQFYLHSKQMKIIEAEITSKMCFLLPDRGVYTVGNFVEDKDGMMYSNDTYRYDRYSFFGTRIGNWGKYSSTSYRYDWDFDRLTILDDDYFLVNGSTGEMYNCGDMGVFAVDRYGMLYEICLDDDGAEYAAPLDYDITAYDPNGYTARYNPEDARYFDIEDAYGNRDGYSDYCNYGVYRY